MNGQLTYHVLSIEIHEKTAILCVFIWIEIKVASFENLKLV